MKSYKFALYYYFALSKIGQIYAKVSLSRWNTVYFKCGDIVLQNPYSIPLISTIRLHNNPNIIYNFYNLLFKE